MPEPTPRETLPSQLVHDISAVRDVEALAEVLTAHLSSISGLTEATLQARISEIDCAEFKLIPAVADAGPGVVAPFGHARTVPLVSDQRDYGWLKLVSHDRDAALDWLTGLGDLVALRLAALARTEGRVCPLTGLMTRREHDKWLLSEAFGEHGMVYYGQLEIDRLDLVDADYGYSAVESVLVEAAKRLRRILGQDALLARVAEKGFAFAIQDPSNATYIDALGPRILSEIAMPVRVGKLSVTVTASLGLTRAPAETLRLDYLTKSAERALCEIKEQGGNGVMLTEASRSRMMDQTSLKIRDALEQGEITAFLQPLYHAASQRLVGFEALTRWRRPNGDIIGPADYLGPIQRLGLTSKHCRCVMAALQAFSDHCPSEVGGLHLNINVSNHELSDPDLVQDLCEWSEAMCAAGFVPVMEINEDTILQSGDDGISGAVIRLAAAGAKISLDDFGTGRGSATRLLSIPAHQLKIDRRFVRIMHEDPQGMAVVRALLVLAEGFNMDTVAEGVETEADVKALQELGCTILQGFYYAPALPMERALALVRQDSASVGGLNSSAG